MSHLKKDFTFHKLFGNKYYEHSYIAYLCNHKTRYTMNSGLSLDRYIVITIDFIIRINNAICRRGIVEQNKKDIKELYSTPLNLEIYKYYGTRTIVEIYNNVKSDEITGDIKQEIYDILRQVIEWKDKFENNYDDFKDFIFDTMKKIDDEHYTYLVGENIIYDRSERDNADKSYYCIVLGRIGYERFKKVYYSKVYINAKEKSKVFEQVCDLLITIGDVYNEMINKEYDNAFDILKNYIDDNEAMKDCKDIYYAKMYVDLQKLKDLFHHKQHTTIIKELKSIIINEITKYKKDLLLYENIAIDKDTLNNGKYYEI